MKYLAGKRLLDLKDRIEKNFTRSNWADIGLLTNCKNIIKSHQRLLRSLDFGDDDYGSSIIDVLESMSLEEPSSLDTISGYLDDNYPDDNEEYI